MRRIALSLISLTLLFAVPSTADYTAGVAAYQAKGYAEPITQFQAAIEQVKVGGCRRVEENLKIKQENEKVDQRNAGVEELEGVL